VRQGIDAAVRRHVRRVHARTRTARAADASIAATAADQFQGIAAGRWSESACSADRSAAARAAYASRTDVRTGCAIAGTYCTVAGTGCAVAGTGCAVRKVEPRIRTDVDRVDATARRKFSSNIVPCAAG